MWLTRFLRAHKFDRLHRTKPANISDEWRFGLPRLQPFLQHGSEFLRPRQKIGFLHDIEHRQGSRAAERVSAESSAKRAFDRRIHDFSAPGHGRNRQTAPERLGRDEKVRSEAKLFAGVE